MSKKRTSLDAAMTLLFHGVAPSRGAVLDVALTKVR
jgi:hypothetical protein